MKKTGVRLKALGLLIFFGIAIGAAGVLLSRVGTHVLPQDTLQGPGRRAQRDRARR